MSVRVVITGIGPVCALGLGREAFADGLRSAASGIRELTLFDAEPFGSILGAEVPDFDVNDYLSGNKAYLDRSSELALAAMRLALDDAGIDDKTTTTAGLALGTAFGSIDTMTLFYEDVLEKGPRYAKPILFPHTYANTAISLIAIEHDMQGYHANFSSGGISSDLALLDAVDQVRHGRCDVVFAGGVEALSETLFNACSLRGWLSPGPTGGDEHCAPFDATRNGFVLGEGACMLVLENEEHARARKANIIAEISTCVAAGDHGTPGSGISPALAALVGRDTLPIDAVVAHANGSVDLDAYEAAGIAAVPALRDTSVTSIKPILGETLGAAGIFQVAAAAVSMQDAQLAPIRDLRSPVSGDVKFVTGRARVGPLNRIATVTLDAGGGVATTLVERESE
jgi:3-oxoacyl-[acyl-carrier-protein] synthase II